MFKKENFTDDFIKFDNGFEIDENLGNQIILGPNGIGKSTIYNTILKIHPEYEHIDYEQLKSDFLKNKNKLIIGAQVAELASKYEEKEKKMTYYSIVKKSNATGKYDTTLELNLPDELVSGKIKNVTLSNVEYQDASNLTQGELNTAILQRDIYFKNANNDYDYFLTLANIEKNMYNRNSIKISKQDEYKISINSISSGSKDYAIIKYITTWKYEEYKYKLS